MKTLKNINLQELSIDEKKIINGGDEPAYGIGYAIGSVVNYIGGLIDIWVEGFTDPCGYGE